MVEARDPEARVALANLMRLEREIVELRYTQRLDATERVREALRRLDEAGGPQRTLERAAEELGSSAGFECVMISRLRAGALLPAALWQRDPSADALDLLAAPLGTLAAEARVVAAPATVLVGADERTAPPATRPHVLAAITLRGESVGVLHAIPPRTGSPTALERELVAMFVVGLDAALERAALEQSLQRHRAALAAGARFMERRLGAAPLAQDASGPESPAAGAPIDPLTARERDVLRLLAGGLTNRAIAQRLAISEGTVKYHVKNILRKLRARSRADAVARHLRAGAER